MLEFQQKETFMEKYLDLLAESPLFEQIDPIDIPVMLKCLQVHNQFYSKGSLIRSEGDTADFIGIVLQGNIQILQYDYNGNRNIHASFLQVRCLQRLFPAQIYFLSLFLFWQYPIVIFCSLIKIRSCISAVVPVNFTTA